MTWLGELIAGATGSLPWQVDDVIKGATSLIGGAADVFSNDKKRVNEQVAVGGFEKLPQDIQDSVLAQVRAGISTPRAELPMRQLYASEMNAGNIFNNPALIALQQYKNMKAQQMPQPVPEMPMPQIPSQEMPLAGYNPDTQTFTTGFGQQITGDDALKAAQTRANMAQFEDMMQQSGRSMKGAGWVMPSISMTEEGRVNPFTGETFNKAGALEALGQGNLDEVFKQAGTAVYDPTRSLMQRLIPMAALAAIGAPIAGAVAPAVTGATGSSLLGNLAGKATTSLLGRAGN